MSFDNFKSSSLRPFLFPVSFVAGLYIKLRNWLFDKEIIKSASFNFPVICVGNLSVGGTGKSPMIEYLIKLLQPSKKVAVLSRGYKRKTKGYVLANANSTALEIGDEPMQFHKKFPGISVAVCEERAVGIPLLLHDRPDTQVLLLDDAFQHRHVKAGCNIVLIQFDAPFWKDSYLPGGNLRDEAGSLKRASAIVVTKSPLDITPQVKQAFENQIRQHTTAPIFFSAISYGQPYSLQNETIINNPSQSTAVLVVTGIANPKPLEDLLSKRLDYHETLYFSDHHIFTIDDLRSIQSKFESIEAANKMILTTEKDAVRFEKFGNELSQLPIFALPIAHQILFGEERKFDSLILSFVNAFGHHSK